MSVYFPVVNQSCLDKQCGIIARRPGCIIDDPEWLYWECYFYQGLVFGNTADFCTNEFRCIPCLLVVCFVSEHVSIFGIVHRTAIDVSMFDQTYFGIFFCSIAC